MKIKEKWYLLPPQWYYNCITALNKEIISFVIKFMSNWPIKGVILRKFCAFSQNGLYLSICARARAQDISGTVYRIELKFSGMIRVLKLNCKMYIKIPNFQNLKSIKVLPPLGQKPDFQKNTKKLIIQEIFAQLI